MDRGRGFPSPSTASGKVRSALENLEKISSGAWAISPAAASSFSSPSDRMCSFLSWRTVKNRRYSSSSGFSA